METHRLDIPERLGGGYVDIRAKRSWAAATRVEGTGTRIEADKNAPDGAVATIDAVAKGLAVLESAVVAWSLPLPAARAGFLSDDFDPDVGDWLVDAIEDYYASLRRGDEERKTDAAPSTES